MSSQDEMYAYLIGNGWKVTPNLRYVDPKTKRLFARQFAEIVQRGYDDEALAKSRAKAVAKEYKSVMKLQKWLETDHEVDEVYPPGSVWDERDLPKGLQVFRGSQVEFSFGKHKGKCLTKVLNENPDYVLWLNDKGIAKFPASVLKIARENSREECYKNKPPRK